MQRISRQGIHGIGFLNGAAFLWSIFGLIIYLVYDNSDWRATAGILLISQAFTGRLALLRIKPLKSALFPDFLTMVLLYQFFTKTLTLIGLVVKNNSDEYGLTGKFLDQLESVPVLYQLQAELVFLLATFIFVLLWRWQEKKKSLAIWNEPTTTSTWIAYGVNSILFFVITMTGLGNTFGMITTLLHIFSIGAIGILLCGKSDYSLGRSKSWISIIALMPVLTIALRSGMKSEVGLIFFPFFISIVMRLNAHRVAWLFAFFIFTTLFLFPFSESWRNENWRATTTEQKLPIGDVSRLVMEKWEREGFFETAQSSTAKWLSRGSSAEQGGLVMLLAERDGFIGSILIEGIGTIFIPRILWPEKPTYTPGAWFTWYLGRAESPEAATTATAMMLATELYWMYGVLGVVVGMALIGVLYFKVWEVLVKNTKNGVAPVLALFSMLARTNGMEEVHTIYAISSPIILMVYVILWNIGENLIINGKVRIGLGA